MTTPILLPEWAKQRAVLLVWPHQMSDWSSQLSAIEATYFTLAHALSQTVTVVVLCHDQALQTRLTALLPAACLCVVIPTNDTWIRDSGPITVSMDGQTHWLDFKFDAWGGKYASNLDQTICPALYTALARTPVPPPSQPPHSVDWVLEGGSIDSNGEGCLLTTRQCLLTASRNPGLKQADFEQAFGRLLGVEKTHWLTEGALAGDDTDSHVDMLARFCDPHTIAYTQCTSRHHPNYATLQAMQCELQALTDKQGQPYQCVPLPLPDPICEHERLLPASYANFLVTNEQVLVPVYHDHADDVALRRLDDVFPTLRITPVDSRVLIRQNGVIHCATMPIFEDIS